MTRDDVMQEARKWLGTPYRQKGRGPDGLDCIGLLVVIGRAFNVPHEDYLDYADWPAQDYLILRIMHRFLRFVPPGGNKAGLIGIFTERRLPGHVGIFTTKHYQDHIIHARMDSRRVTEQAMSSLPQGELRLIATFAFPELEL